MTNEQAERLVSAVERIASMVGDMQEEQRKFQKIAMDSKDSMPEQLMNLFTNIKNKNPISKGQDNG